MAPHLLCSLLGGVLQVLLSCLLSLRHSLLMHLWHHKPADSHRLQWWRYTALEFQHNNTEHWGTPTAVTLCGAHERCAVSCLRPPAVLCNAMKPVPAWQCPGPECPPPFQSFAPLTRPACERPRCPGSPAANEPAHGKQLEANAIDIGTDVTATFMLGLDIPEVTPLSLSSLHRRRRFCNPRLGWNHNSFVRGTSNFATPSPPGQRPAAPALRGRRPPA